MSVCVSGRQGTSFLRHIVLSFVVCLALPYFSQYLLNGKTEHKIRFYPQILSETYLILEFKEV